MRSFTGFRALVATVTAAEGDIFTELAPFGFARFLGFLFLALLMIFEFAYTPR
jgi:hypothetical protein